MERIDLTSGGCYEQGHSKDNRGLVWTRSIFFNRDGETYSIRVATPDALAEIKRLNEGFDPDEGVDENVFVLKDVSDLDQICQQLRTLPILTLAPYVTKQEEI